MHQGQVVKVAGDDEKIAIEDGNRMKLRDIPLGSTIHNIEITAGRGGQAVRAAGASAQLTAKEGDYAMVRMPSGEVRKFHLECMATLGVVGNEQTPEHQGWFRRTQATYGHSTTCPRCPHERCRSPHMVVVTVVNTVPVRLLALHGVS